MTGLICCRTASREHLRFGWTCRCLCGALWYWDRRGWGRPAPDRRQCSSNSVRPVGSDALDWRRAIAERLAHRRTPVKVALLDSPRWPAWEPVRSEILHAAGIHRRSAAIG